MTGAIGERNCRILVIDDNAAVHDDFRKVIGGPRDGAGGLAEARSAIFGGPPVMQQAERFDIDSALQGEDGLALVREAVRAERPYAMAFVDMRMPPGWDGFETIAHIWDEDPALQIVICTAYSDKSWVEFIKKVGRTDSLLVLKKPFDTVEVRQLASALTEKWNLGRQVQHRLVNLEDVVEQRTAQVVQTRDVTLFALAKLAESRDPETGEHLDRIRLYCRVLAEHMSGEGPYASEIDGAFVEDLFRSSPLHDIGKVGISDAILLKPGRLTPDEFEVMKQHAVIGAETLDEAARHATAGGFLTMAAEIARSHHERFDGTGYPEGRVGRAIPLSARIVALADVYDALTSKRVYKPAYAPEEAQSMILEEESSHFDPWVVSAFRAREQEFLDVLRTLPDSSGQGSPDAEAARRSPVFECCEG